MLKSGKAAALLVVKLDRRTRSVRDLGTLVEQYFADPNGPALLSVGEQVDTRTAGGRLVLNVLGAVSQWEREAIGERTAAAMRHMAAQGVYPGGETPFGFRLGEVGRLDRHQAEAECNCSGSDPSSCRALATGSGGSPDGFRTPL
jgi:site-specific DNA recombinase